MAGGLREVYTPNVSVGHVADADIIGILLNDAIVDVRDPGFAGGAVLNGAHDDTPCFVAAMADPRVAAGGVIFIGRGQPRVSAVVLSITGLSLVGAGPFATFFRIAGNGTGVKVARARCRLVDFSILSAGGFTPTDYIRLEASAGQAINRTVIRNIDIIGDGKAAGNVGLYIRGLELVAGVYNTGVENLMITQCQVGLQAYTVDAGGNPITNTGNQFNAAQTLTNVVIGQCGTGIKARTALNYVWSGLDCESNDVGIDADSIRSWFFSGYGFQGNTTPAIIGSDAKGQGCFLGGNFSGAAFDTAGWVGYGNVTQLRHLRSVRHGDNFGNLDNLLIRGDFARAGDGYGSTVTTNAAANGNGPFYTVQTTEVTDGKETVLQFLYQITGVETSSGDTLSGVYIASFKATRAGAVVTVTQLGATSTVHETKSNAGWGVTIGVDGSATSIRPIVHGAVGDGSIAWDFAYRLLQSRGT